MRVFTHIYVCARHGRNGRHIGRRRQTTATAMSSVGYASRLNRTADVGGTLGETETEDPAEDVRRASRALAEALVEAREATRDGRLVGDDDDGDRTPRSGVVVHTGAGISTSVGIPDFRGPDGVWTRRARGLPPPECSTALDRAKPSFTHACLKALADAGYVKTVVSCNVDCLHVKSGLIPGENLCELHGNLFAERCENGDCGREEIRDFEMKTVGRKLTGRRCVECGGRMRDQVLDWDDALPEKELNKAERDSADALWSVVIGSSLQIMPSCNIPLRTTRKRRRSKQRPYGDDEAPGKLCVVNLQKTTKDKKAALVIHAKCDEVMRLVAGHLDLKIPDYERTDRVRVFHECRDRPTGFDFVLRVVNAHDEAAPIPWLDKVVCSFDKETGIEAANLVRQPFSVKRRTRIDEAIRVRLAFHFATGCTEPPAEVSYELEYEGKGREKEYEFVTIRQKYDDSNTDL